MVVSEQRWAAVGNATATATASASAKDRVSADAESFKWINPDSAHAERCTDYFFNTSWARDGATVWRWVSEVALFRAARAAVRRARASGAPPIARCWSVGCSSGEEVWTLRFLWLAWSSRRSAPRGSAMASCPRCTCSAPTAARSA